MSDLHIHRKENKGGNVFKETVDERCQKGTVRVLVIREHFVGASVYIRWQNRFRKREEGIRLGNGCRSAATNPSHPQEVS